MSDSLPQPRKIVLHLGALIPHYFPLYLGCHQLKQKHPNLTIELAIPRGEVSSRLLFQQAEKRLREPDTLHLVVAGQIENEYPADGSSTFREIDDFVSANLLIHRTPLWIFAREKRKEAVATALITNGGNKVAGILPAKTSTLFEAFGHEFSLASVTELENADASIPFKFDVGASAFENADFFVSIFPHLAVIPADFIRLNERPLPRHTGFSALWIAKQTVRNDYELSFWIEIADAVQDAMCALYRLDSSQLNAQGTDPMGYVKAKIASGEVTPPNWKEIGFPSEPEWSKHLPLLLAEFIIHRIWDYNFMHAHRSETLDLSKRSKLPILYPRAITAYLRSAQTERFRDKFAEYVDAILAKADVLKDVSKVVEQMSMALKGGFNESSEADALAQQSADLLNRFFPTGTHSVHDYYASGTFNKDAANLVAKKMSDDVTTLCKVFRSLSKALDNQNEWVGEELQVRFKKLAAFLSAVQLKRDVDALFATDEQVVIGEYNGDYLRASLLLLELKALSRGGLPSSWLLLAAHERLVANEKAFNKVRYGYEALEKQFTFRQIMGSNVSKPFRYLAPFGLFSCCRLLREFECQLVSYCRETVERFTTIQFTLEQKDSGSLKPLIGALCGLPGERVGSSTGKLLLLQNWGFEVRVNEEESRVSIPVFWNLTTDNL